MIDWQPIETAPKDGTVILACVVGTNQRGKPWVPTVVQWGGDHNPYWWDAGSYCDPMELYHPTHWAPINYPK